MDAPDPALRRTAPVVVGLAAMLVVGGAALWWTQRSGSQDEVVQATAATALARELGGRTLTVSTLVAARQEGLQLTGVRLEGSGLGEATSRFLDLTTSYRTAAVDVVVTCPGVPGEVVLVLEVTDETGTTRLVRRPVTADQVAPAVARACG